MESEKTIRVNFNNARDQAKKLSGYADDLGRIEKELNEIIAELHRGWEGDAANTFISKCSQMKEKISQSAANLQTISGAVTKAAQSYYQAEMRAIEIAKASGAGAGGGGI